MKNFEKYNTPNEASIAHYNFCQKVRGKCHLCPAYNCRRSCIITWLYAEAETEKPTPQWQKNLLNKFTSKE